MVEMNLFGGRILITNFSNEDDEDDWDDAIANILNHKSSRATIYVIAKSIEDIRKIRQKFPTVVPFVFIPDVNVDQTRRMLKLLPHMDHFVNFLGQDIALEFLNKRSNFRIKDVSRAYARSNVMHKILLTDGQGIIFNVNHSDNYCKDNVTAAGIAAKKSLKKNVKKVFIGIAGPSSSDERQPLFSKDKVTHSTEQVGVVDTADNNSTSTNNFWRYIISLFYFICPCIEDERVVIPVNEYPPDLDAKFAEAFEKLYKSLEVEWYLKREEAKQVKEKAIKQLQNAKEERVEKEYNRLMGINRDLTSTPSNRLQAFCNVKNNIKMAKEKINREYEQKMHLLNDCHYQVTVEKQIEMLVSLWKKMRLTPQ